MAQRLVRQHLQAAGDVGEVVGDQIDPVVPVVPAFGAFPAARGLGLRRQFLGQRDHAHGRDVAAPLAHDLADRGIHDAGVHVAGALAGGAGERELVLVELVDQILQADGTAGRRLAEDFVALEGVEPRRGLAGGDLVDHPHRVGGAVHLHRCGGVGVARRVAVAAGRHVVDPGDLGDGLQLAQHAHAQGVAAAQPQDLAAAGRGEPDLAVRRGDRLALQLIVVERLGLVPQRIGCVGGAFGADRAHLGVRAGEQADVAAAGLAGAQVADQRVERGVDRLALDAARVAVALQQAHFLRHLGRGLVHLRPGQVVVAAAGARQLVHRVGLEGAGELLQIGVEVGVLRAAVQQLRLLHEVGFGQL